MTRQQTKRIRINQRLQLRKSMIASLKKRYPNATRSIENQVDYVLSARNRPIGKNQYTNVWAPTFN